MASYVKSAAEAGDKYLTSLSEFQDNFLKAVTTGAERIKTASGTPAFEFPVPTAADVAEANFAFAQKLLKQQKTFIEKLLATATPATK